MGEPIDEQKKLGSMEWGPSERVEEIPSDDDTEPQELSKELVIAANGLGERFAELNKLYENRIAAEAVDNEKFKRLYDQHQSEQAEKVHELDALQRKLE